MSESLKKNPGMMYIYVHLSYYVIQMLFLFLGRPLLKELKVSGTRRVILDCHEDNIQVLKTWVTLENAFPKY